jgi:hypothetical protein
MFMSITKYTRELLTKVVAENNTMVDVMKAFGSNPSGGLHNHLLRRTKEWGISIDHFVGKGHLRGKKHYWGRSRQLEDVMTEKSNYNRVHLKRRLLQCGLLKNECSLCGQLPEFNGKPLVMILDHINGVYDDHRLINLRLLCPNCNSQQDTFGSRNRKRHSYQHVLEVVKELGVKKASKELAISESGVRLRLRNGR